MLSSGPAVQPGTKTLEEEAGSRAGLLLFGQTFSGPEVDLVNVVLVWSGMGHRI